MAKKGRKVKGPGKAMAGGKLSSSMSKATKKALKHMPKSERAMVLSTLKSASSAAWSQKRIMDHRKGTKESAAASTRPAGPQQSAFALFSKSNQRVLLIGEGNFSFAVSLVSLFNGHGENVTATCFDSREVLHEKYSDAKANVKALTNSGASVHFEVDGTKLWAFHGLDPPYDLVIFNFPHVGLGIKDQAANIAANQELVSGFLASAQKFVHPQGALCVTVKKGEPYDSWKIARLGLAVPGLRLKTAVEFEPSAFPAFAHRRTAGERSSAEGAEEDNGLIGNGAKTFVFSADKAEDKDGKGKDKAKAKAKGVAAGGKRNRK